MIAHGEGHTGPPLVTAIRRWAATAALIVVLTLFRSVNLCVGAIFVLAAFLESSPVGTWMRDLRRG